MEIMAEQFPGAFSGYSLQVSQFFLGFVTNTKYRVRDDPIILTKFTFQSNLIFIIWWAIFFFMFY